MVSDEARARFERGFAMTGGAAAAPLNLFRLLGPVLR